MEDEINLREYIAVIQKRWKLIALLAIICAIVVLFNGLSQPKLYKATATLMLTDSSGGGLASALSSLSFLGGGGGAAGGSSALLPPILKSQALAKEIAKSLDLKLMLPKIAEDIKLSDEEKIRLAAGKISGKVDGLMGKSGFFEVTGTWNDPQISAYLTNKYVEGLGRFLNARAISINFQLIDPAEPPGGPFNRDLKKSLMTGLMVGVFAGVFISFALEYLSKIYRRS
ncbi:MAG: Wzz/FepE/Etk N-terminal domain-containing protein [Candidatus Margulisiibacteriota bacterium]